MLSNVDTISFLSAFREAVPAGSDYALRWVSGADCGVIGVYAQCIGDMLTAMQSFLDDYCARFSCAVEYIHGEDAVMGLAAGEGRLGLILPAMDKAELFGTVTRCGVFPKKSFSVGHSWDKRYYLECRAITLSD